MARRLALASTALALLLAGCGGAVGGPGGAPDPGGDPDANVRLPPRAKLFGFNSGAFTWTGREPDLDIGVTPERQAADALAGGANTVRVPFSWWELEPRRGQFDTQYLSLMDRFVRALERGGGRVLLLLAGPPPWASLEPGNPAGAPRPEFYDAFAKFAALAARRYPRAAGIETRNEPNSVFGWRPAPDPAAYARFHRIVARAIRAERPRMKVILGGLAAPARAGAEIMDTKEFLDGMYEAGLRPSDYSAIGFHPYPAQAGGAPKPLDEGHFANVFQRFRDGLEGHDPDARVWITETGLTTAGPAALTPAEQAEAIPPLVRKLLTIESVDAVYVHTLYDLVTRPQGNPLRGFGLLTPRGRRAPAPKPAFCELRRMVRSPAPYRGCP